MTTTEKPVTPADALQAMETLTPDGLQMLLGWVAHSHPDVIVQAVRGLREQLLRAAR